MTWRTSPIDRYDFDTDAKPSMPLKALVADLRTDHAGESGAVMIYCDEAAALFVVFGKPPSLALRVWVWSVGLGSRVAVKICRRV